MTTKEQEAVAFTGEQNSKATESTGNVGGVRQNDLTKEANSQHPGGTSEKMVRLPYTRVMP